MTDRSEKIVEAVARALVERDGWDFDNMPKPARAPYLGASRAALLAVLPMLAEEIDELLWHGKPGLELRDPAGVVRSAFSSLIEDLKT